MTEGRIGPDWAMRGIAVGALVFVLTGLAFAQGHLVRFDQAANTVLRDPFGRWSDPGGTYDYVVLQPGPEGNASADNLTAESGSDDDWDDWRPARDGWETQGAMGTGNRTCQRADTLGSPALRESYRTPPRTMACEGNFTLTLQAGGSWVDPPWGGYASYFGSTSAAFALLVATALLLAALGAWRTAIVALAAGIVGGALVDPMKGFFAPLGHAHYGALDMADRFPSGHTIGATLQFGLFLLMGTAALRRAGLAQDPRLPRRAAIAWAAIAVACGLDRVVVHAHILSDVVAGWGFGLALVCAAVWADRRWHAAVAARSAPAASEAVA